MYFQKLYYLKISLIFRYQNKKSFESLIFLMNRKISNTSMKNRYIVSKIFVIIITIKTKINEKDIYRKILKNSNFSI